MTDARPRDGRGTGRPLGRRAIIALVVGALLGLLLLGAASLWALRARREARVAPVARSLERRLADFGRQRWRRPPLGSPAVDGNAWAIIQRAAGRLPRPPDEAVRAALDDGTPAPSALRELGTSHRDARAALLGSTRARWSWVRAEGSPFQSPPFLPLLRAARMELALAQDAGPAECLRVGAQVVRMGQDAAAGGGILGLVIGATMTQEAVKVSARCAARASADERRTARVELELLATHTPPPGSAMELEALLTCAAALGMAAGAPLVPLGSEDLATWRLSDDAFAALPRVCERSAAWRALPYPALLHAVDREDRARAASHNRWLAIAGPDHLRMFVRDASAQAQLRALVVALGDADERSGARGAHAPPDPFTGRALRVERTAVEVRVRSVGPDRHDDGGAGDDLVVHVATSSPAP